MPDGGYTFRGDIPNSGYVIEENAKDVYLLLCDGDAKKLRRLYATVAVRPFTLHFGAVFRYCALSGTKNELVLRGDTYRLSNPFDGDYFCVALVSKDKTAAYVALRLVIGACGHVTAHSRRGIARRRTPLYLRALERVGVVARPNRRARFQGQDGGVRRGRARSRRALRL